MKKVTIYTDGACSGNPGPGGWGAILYYKSHKKEISGSEKHTTNNRMELSGAIQALELLKEACEVELYTDSAYLCRAFQENWLATWQKNGWQNSKKQPVENRDLWEQLLLLTSKHKVYWNKVKGHSDNENNNRCDYLARNAIKTMLALAADEESIEKNTEVLENPL
ncbi:ribonuclease HI [Eubacteriales bacterium OttesenSCG-928-K08]|nr:ribonuclease HI [Eubacteriales bacterium OttesenSCG-928-K08]